MIEQTARIELYLAHRTALINYALAVVGERMQAEDVVQDAFLRFSAQPDTRIEQPLAYLYRIVRNLALDAVRRNAAESRRQQRPPDWLQPGTMPTPEQSVLHAEEIRRIAKALAELPEQAQIAIEMHRLGGYTLQQIAEHLGVSLTTAHRLVREAVVHLASNLDADNHGQAPQSKDPSSCTD